MIYGLYLSASGVIANSHREDVIANNLANAETTGFKRNTTAFQQRLTEAQQHRNLRGLTDPLQDSIGGGLFVAPSGLDLSQGELEGTGNNLDLAVQGSGYFAVDDHGTTRLTRNGRFMLDHDNHLIVADGTGQRVLDRNLQPIVLDAQHISKTEVGQYGEITQNGKPAGNVGLFDVNDTKRLIKHGGTMIDYADTKGLKPATGSIRSEFLERANVDPATELTHLMDSQRQLEANANMIKFQDDTLGKAVNDVGKLS